MPLSCVCESPLIALTPLPNRLLSGKCINVTTSARNSNYLSDPTRYQEHRHIGALSYISIPIFTVGPVQEGAGSQLGVADRGASHAADGPAAVVRYV